VPLSSWPPHLPAELFEQALDTACQIQDDSYRASALGSLAQQGHPELFEQALEAARQIQDDYTRAIALGSLARQGHPTAPIPARSPLSPAQC
jgi:pyridoxine/pyridoxamine 5'-phosphate oxidase